MRPLFGHAPRVEHHYLVGVAHGRETVRNHEQLTQRFGEQDALFFHPMILNAVEVHNDNLARALMQAHILQNYDKV